MLPVANYSMRLYDAVYYYFRVWIYAYCSSSMIIIHTMHGVCIL